MQPINVSWNALGSFELKHLELGLCLDVNCLCIESLFTGRFYDAHFWAHSSCTHDTSTKQTLSQGLGTVKSDCPH